MTACLIVRAKVEPFSKNNFDLWYRKEHLTDAFKALGPLTAKRGWSLNEPNTHIAIYEFPDLTAATNAQKIKELILEFDRHWEGKVTRTREVVDLSQSL